jgi:orotate phosphoribosyltransferase
MTVTESSGTKGILRELMTRDELLGLFRRSGALLDGHFRLSSGLHSSGYLQCALVLQHPRHAEALGRALADRTRDFGATVVLSPALGGVVIGHEVGRGLGVRAVFAERQDGALTLRRGFTIGEDDRVLVVEDVLTTGGSTRETMQVAVAAGGRVVGAASVVDRSGGAVRWDVPFAALLEIALPTYEASQCPLCAQGLPLVKPGSRPVAA